MLIDPAHPRAYLMVDVVAVVVGLALAIGAWLFGVSPIMNASAQREADIAELTIAESNASKAAKELSRLNDQIGQYRESIETHSVTLMSVDYLKPAPGGPERLCRRVRSAGRVGPAGQAVCRRPCRRGADHGDRALRVRRGGVVPARTGQAVAGLRRDVV